MTWWKAPPRDFFIPFDIECFILRELYNISTRYSPFSQKYMYLFKFNRILSCLFINYSHIVWNSLQLCFLAALCVSVLSVQFDLWLVFFVFLTTFHKLCIKTGSVEINPLWHHTATSGVSDNSSGRPSSRLSPRGPQSWKLKLRVCCKHRANMKKKNNQCLWC